MTDSYRQWPKAELHVHLEGSIEPETVRELDPSLTLKDVHDNYTFSDFAGFIRSYVWVNRMLRGPSEYSLITRRLLEQMALQNIRYAEINVSVGVMLWKNQDAAELFDAIEAEAGRASMEVRWIFDAVRHFGPEAAIPVAEFAAQRSDRGVVGFGIGGDEARGPAEWFRDVFQYAENAGLAVLPHAGETVGPESIWQALELGASRIGHGFRTIDDPVLIRHLRDHDIPLEICLTSNVCTGAITSIAEHPVRRLYDAGVPITLNTDDPGIFRTTLANEFELAAKEFGFTEEELRGIAENAFRFRCKA